MYIEKTESKIKELIEVGIKPSLVVIGDEARAEFLEKLQNIGGADVKWGDGGIFSGVNFSGTLVDVVHIIGTGQLCYVYGKEILK